MSQTPNYSLATREPWNRITETGMRAFLRFTAVALPYTNETIKAGFEDVEVRPLAQGFPVATITRFLEDMIKDCAASDEKESDVGEVL
ncbi:MAG: hypothetical protein PHH36_03505 [Sideroxydans sp.]|nr:hypothetical protein [Sideroxydans sp.]